MSKVKKIADIFEKELSRKTSLYERYSSGTNSYYLSFILRGTKRHFTVRISDHPASRLTAQIKGKKRVDRDFVINSNSQDPWLQLSFFKDMLTINPPKKK